MQPFGHERESAGDTYDGKGIIVISTHSLVIFSRYKYKYPRNVFLCLIFFFPPWAVSAAAALITSMAAVSDHRPSSLNPNAPMFVPWAYRAVEDFSDEWWELVQSSACFRDYWLQECFQEPQDFYHNGDDIDLLEIDAAFDGYKPADEEGERGSKDVVSLAALKWGKNRVMPEPPKYAEKAPKVVSVKVRPRMIQQPR